MFRVTESPVPGLREALVAWLLDYLHDAVADGRRFTVGEIVQVGWRQLRVIERRDGLGLLERIDADEWAEHVHLTLRDLWFQREVVSSILLTEQLSFPAEQQSALVTECVDEDTQRLLVERTTPHDAHSSGWRVCCGIAHDHGDWIPLPLTDLVASMPFVAQFLALPAPASVELDAPDTTPTGLLGARISIRGRRVRPLPGSYLAAFAA